MDIKTPSDLKYEYERIKGASGHFFDRATMRFFGDTMKNYGVRDCGKWVELFRRRSVKHGLNSSTYFHKKTMRETKTKPEG